MQTLFSENEIVDKIANMIKPEIKGNATITLKRNKSSYNSIVVKSEKTTYRCFNTSEMLFARIKSEGNTQYISFPSSYSETFESAGINYKTIKSDPGFIRINLDIFSPLSSEFIKLPNIMTQIFINLFTFPAFGCCGLFEKCSDAGQCLHEDKAYATACSYRRNLEQGKIFYGKNKNI